MREDEFNAALDRHLQAISNRNLGDFQDTVDERVRLIGTDGAAIDGRDAAVAAHARWFSDESWRFVPRILFFERHGEAGWALAHVRYEAAEKTSEFYLFLLFKRGDDGRWRLLYDQGTSIA